MNMQKALGIIETYGLLAGIAVADVMVKAADVELIGYELARGQGMTVIKVQGDVGAVKAAIASGEAQARELGLFRSKDVIPRPAANLDAMVFNERTVGQVPPPSPESYNRAGKAARARREKAAAEPQALSEAEAVRGSSPETASFTCNLCQDPACPRLPRQPHKLCLHFSENKQGD